MFNRSALLALVASAAVGLVTLSATGADARPIGGGGGGGGGHRVVHGGGGGHFNFRGNVHHARFNHLRVHHHRRPVHLPSFRFAGCRWSHNCYWPHWRRYVVATNYVNTAYPVPRPAASTCTCLVKEYLPNGSVLFRDVCTNESAVNPPADAPTGS